MCRAILVLCVAADAESLVQVKQASVGAEWELAPGAIEPGDALAQLKSTRAHCMVAWGPGLGDLIRTARENFPGLRIITDDDVPEASAVVASLDEVRSAITGLPRPGGPVRA